ncbi:hypothetical protein SDC9_160852 [bioreactor metagenome]|uniref:Uncharacterized protein n=1 Tax=bioreactor metagenome TaxID=1076179 RepID=A0A645FGN0_9ZZZZ
MHKCLFIKEFFVKIHAEDRNHFLCLDIPDRHKHACPGAEPVSQRFGDFDFSLGKGLITDPVGIFIFIPRRQKITGFRLG